MTEPRTIPPEASGDPDDACPHGQPYWDCLDGCEPLIGPDDECPDHDPNPCSSYPNCDLCSPCQKCGRY